MIAAVLALAVAASADPCEPVEPAPEPDPVAAAAYRAVGEEERSKGAFGTAAIAYRAAAALDPADVISRSVLRELCRQRVVQGPDPFLEGLDLMSRGELREAIEVFEQLRAAGPDASASLLEGVCYYRLGDDLAASPLLREAEADLEVRDSARLYLGLVALRRGESSQAASLFDAVASGAGYGIVASDLALLARRTGRFSVSAVTSLGWNSNLTLAPFGYASTGDSDGSASIALNGAWRPAGENGPFVRLGGGYQQQFHLQQFNLGSLAGALGWQLGHADRAILAEYSYSYSVLGGSPYLSANRLLASGWLTSGSFEVTATYFARFESYQSVYSPFSGTLQWAEARGAWWLGPTMRVGVSYRVGADGVSQDYLSWIEHGPHADFLLQLGRSLRVGFDATLGFRPYRGAIPGQGTTRFDTLLAGAALAEYDLGNHWAAQLSVAPHTTLSNLSEFSYFAFVPTLGIAYIAGF